MSGCCEGWPSIGAGGNRSGCGKNWKAAWGNRKRAGRVISGVRTLLTIHRPSAVGRSLGLRPSPRGELEYYAFVVNSPAKSGAVEVAGGVQNHSAYAS
jgi:hypothetical protein